MLAEKTISAAPRLFGGQLLRKPPPARPSGLFRPPAFDLRPARRPADELEAIARRQAAAWAAARSTVNRVAPKRQTAAAHHASL
jgi:hypothetical protein